MKKQCKNNKSCRLNKVGGQAVLEGVMMKAGSRTVTTCRKEDGSIFQSDGEFVSIRKKHKWLNFPILRGVDFTTLYFTTETAAQVRAITHAHIAGENPPFAHTYGLYGRTLL